MLEHNGYSMTAEAVESACGLFFIDFQHSPNDYDESFVILALA
jgi:hypothetical protein